MNDQNITRHDYGGKVETNCEKFIEGLIELFDDLSDFALSRIHKKIFESVPNYNVNKLPQKDINHFKLTWYITLAELMFFSMKSQPKLEEIRNMFYTEMEITAAERNATPFLMEARTTIPRIIMRNKDFTENGIFNTPTSNRAEDTPRNNGLGPELARIIMETSFSTNPIIGTLYDDILEIFELEFNNAYGHCSISCATFSII
ncbi:MAG TPA: hypothetical protein EYQ26_07745 [Rhodospirillales bacterium]|nr:hypothetical protein [Rhodospirillales bacterium]HIL76844.1 hypothetical protein [Rhodospirillales bacterium]